MSNSANDLAPNDSVKNDIRSCFEALGTFSKAEIDMALQLIAIKTFEKGEHLVRQGEVSVKSYAVVTGCIRQYYLVDGEEKTTFFYTEGQSIFPPCTATDQQPAKFNLSCVERTTVTIMTLENQQEMFARFPMLESLSRMALQEELNHYQEMLANYITTSPEERYQNLIAYRPELIKRVPQYQLASYLGVTPESLSRIRKRIFLK